MHDDTEFSQDRPSDRSGGLPCGEAGHIDVARLQPRSARSWARRLAEYRRPDLSQSLTELAATLLPYLALLSLACLALPHSRALAAAIGALNGLFLVRLFMIQHDCGHGAFFPGRAANDALGRLLGVLTLTPYRVWRHWHAVHHGSVGDLDARGMGDVPTLTLREYRALPRHRRLGYRLLRHPLVMFGLVPTFVFFIRYRWPVGLTGAGVQYWRSAMGTNLAIAAALAAAIRLAGPEVLWVLLPTPLVGATIGMWLFFVQHQFENTSWSRAPDWDLHEAALQGSSHLVLPPVLRWVSANIGVHHVHHLQSRIPFYRLPEVLRDHPALDAAQRLTLRDAMQATTRHLWHEETRRLITFREARLLCG